LLWAFSLSMGADYQLNNRFHINAGAGLGINNKQYGIFSEMLLLTPFLGIDYRFEGIKKK